MRTICLLLIWVFAAASPLRALAAVGLAACGDGAASAISHAMHVGAGPHHVSGTNVGDAARGGPAQAASHGPDQNHAQAHPQAHSHSHAPGHSQAHSPAHVHAQASPDTVPATNLEAPDAGESGSGTLPAQALKCSSCAPCCAAAAPAPARVELPQLAPAPAGVAFFAAPYVGVVAEVPHRPPRTILA